MAQDSNRGKPSHRFYVEYTAGHGYLVLDPNGKIASKAMTFRPQAERLRNELQYVADQAAKRGPRPCLRCEAEFESEGIHNRMCSRCRGLGESAQSVRPAIPARRFG